jgi:adhesin transport system outer membrane protein
MTRFFRRCPVPVLGAVLALSLGGCGWFPLLDGSVFRDPGYTPPPARVAPSLAPTPFGRDVVRAVTTDPLLAGSEARVRGSTAELDGTRALAMPQLSIGLDLVAGVLGVTTGTRYLPVVQVSQLLFDGGRMRARMEGARLGVVGRMIERDTLAAQITLNAAEAWFELAHQRRLLDVARRNLAVHETYIGQLDERLRAGTGIQGDVEIARGRLASAAARAATVQADLERAEANFARIFGTVPRSLATAPLAPSLPPGTESELIANSPRLRGLDAAIIVAQAGVEAADASWWPTVTLGVRGQFDPQTGRAGVETFGSPRYDVFTGGQHAAAVGVAAARLDELRAERRQLERDIVRTLSVLRSDARAGQLRLRSTRDAVRANAASVASARERFAIGRASILQLLDSQRDLASAEELASIAERDLSLSGYAALALTGDIVHAFGLSLPGLDQALNGRRGSAWAGPASPPADATVTAP